MTDYKGPNAFSNGVFKPAKAPTIIPPYQRSPGGVVRKADGPAFNNRFPKSRYRGGGQSGLRPVLEIPDTPVVTPYVAKAVHFDGAAAYLNCPSLLSVDATCFSISFWGKNLVTHNGQIFAVDAAGAYLNWSDNDNMQKFHLALDDNMGNALQFHASDPANYNNWNHILCSVNLDADAGSRIIALYVNDILTPTTIDGDSGVAFSPLINGQSFTFAGDTFSGDSMNGDYADCWIAPGLSLLSGSTIPQAVRRKFISDAGKPVDPIEFPSSAVLFSGDDTTFGTNQGTGGAFTLTGALTNATTSPSD